ncbi:MAG: TetR/AcrR family transcriptional regulator [Myxococcota bacterium]
MGYSAEHVERTRERILASAARLFRRKGFDAAGIDEIMAGAGLTRGGFYAHFQSKADLFAAVLGEELEFAARLRSAREGVPDASDAAALHAIRHYLAPDQLPRIAAGCTMVASAADIARAPKRARKAFTDGFESLVDEFEHLAGGPERRAQALAAVATCVGGVALARTFTDPSLAEALLAACHEVIEAQLGRS